MRAERGRSRASAELRALLDALCSIPEPLDGFEDWERFKHRDLWRLSPSELRTEAARVRDRMRWDPEPNEWLASRLRALTEAIRHGR